MTYAVSDLHGHWERYKDLIKHIQLNNSENTLYILGDSIDRGDGGCRILLDAMQRSNVISILGNHELTAAMCIPWILQEVTDQSLSELREDQVGVLREWILNGGAPTLDELKNLSKAEREAILEYIRDMDIYAEVEAGGRSFLLTHAGLNNFVPNKPLHEYELTDFLFGRSIWKQKFYPDKYLVFGHTPTRALHKQLNEPPIDDIIFYKNQIAIDCGCAYNDGRLGCLCLDTMKIFYL